MIVSVRTEGQADLVYALEPAVANRLAARFMCAAAAAVNQVRDRDKLAALLMCGEEPRNARKKEGAPTADAPTNATNGR